MSLEVTTAPIPLPGKGVGEALLLWDLAWCSLLHSLLHLSNFALLLSHRHGAFIKIFDPKKYTLEYILNFTFPRMFRGIACSHFNPL